MLESSNVFDKIELFIRYSGIGGVVNLGKGFTVQIRSNENDLRCSPHVYVSQDGNSFISLPIGGDKERIIPFDKEQVKIWNGYERKDRREIRKMIVGRCHQLEEFYRTVIKGEIPETVELVFHNKQYCLIGGPIIDCSVLEKNLTIYEEKGHG